MLRMIIVFFVALGSSLTFAAGTLTQNFLCHTETFDKNGYRVVVEMANLDVTTKVKIGVMKEKKEVTFCYFDIESATYSPNSVAPSYVFNLERGKECESKGQIKFASKGFVKVVKGHGGLESFVLGLVDHDTMKCKIDSWSKDKILKMIKDKF